MAIWTECMEIAVAVGPALLSFLLVRKRAGNIRAWFIRVLGSAFLAVISLGLLLMRLTTQCTPVDTQCTPPALAILRSPGIFSACQSCLTPGLTPAAELLNRWALDLQAISAVTCVLVSSFVIIRFMLWARTTLRNSQNKNI